MTAPDAGGADRAVTAATTAATTAGLVAAAASGDAGAWEELVQRYTGLVLGVCRRMRLSEPDALDVSQTIWLRLVEHLAELREPAALPGWLVTATRHEALRTLRRPTAVRFEEVLDLDAAAEPLDADLLAAERRTAVRRAVAALPEDARALLSLLLADPPIPYAEISRRLGIPVGSIGPTRRRLIDKLRARPELATLGPDAPRDGAPATPGPRLGRR